MYLRIVLIMVLVLSVAQVAVVNLTAELATLHLVWRLLLKQIPGKLHTRSFAVIAFIVIIRAVNWNTAGESTYDCIFFLKCKVRSLTSTSDSSQKG